MLMAFFLFGVMNRARGITKALSKAIGAHKAITSNLLSHRKDVIQLVGVDGEMKFRMSVINYLTAGFGMWLAWVKMSEDDDSRKEYAKRLVAMGLLTEEEFRKLDRRSKGTFNKCH